MANGPLEEIEHVIQAVPADESNRALLDMKPGDPVLLMRRRTWSRGMIASSARLLHPGARFSLAGRMVPDGLSPRTGAARNGGQNVLTESPYGVDAEVAYTNSCNPEARMHRRTFLAGHGRCGRRCHARRPGAAAGAHRLGHGHLLADRRAGR